MKIWVFIKRRNRGATFFLSPYYFSADLFGLHVDHHRIRCAHLVLALIFGCFAVFIKISIAILKLFKIRHARISMSGLKNTNDIHPMIVITAFRDRLNQTSRYERPGILLFIASNVLPAFNIFVPICRFPISPCVLVLLLSSILN